ncbi:patatin-like phospholipase family protein [Plantactinospora sp. GCM10030261]|uniref:patatin-like phospholipase family protein n=1 Tax=Plantactinospora sp. GCM10030261 TaxID=3273420 RepID=UPI00361DD0B8
MVAGPVAFVLGGGGVLGAVEVGMLRALFRSGFRPDVVIGTSIGAVNGALVAADPCEAVTDRLVRLWSSPEASEVYGDSVARQLRRFAARTHLHSPVPLRRLLEGELGVGRTFADLAVPFHCCAASIERAAEHWFRAGPVVDAVLASASVPGLLPPMQIDGEHYLDGGIVNSIPIGEAVLAGAQRIFVLQVGRIERPLSPPRRPWEIAQVAFEIARRHRFAREMAALPPGVEVHVLPTGGLDPRDDNPWAYRDMAAVGRRISRAYTASRHYLDAHVKDA